MHKINIMPTNLNFQKNWWKTDFWRYFDCYCKMYFYPEWSHNNVVPYFFMFVDKLTVHRYHNVHACVPSRVFEVYLATIMTLYFDCSLVPWSVILKNWEFTKLFIITRYRIAGKFRGWQFSYDWPKPSRINFRSF